MDKKTFSAPGIRLLANISQATLQRYVKEYSTFLSPGAQSHKKGRTFTERDLNTILLIKRLHFSNSKHDQIAAALASDKNLDQGWMELDEIVKAIREIQDTQKVIMDRLNRLSATVIHLGKVREIDGYINPLNRKLTDLATRVDQLKTDIDKLAVSRPMVTSESTGLGWLDKLLKV